MGARACRCCREEHASEMLFCNLNQQTADVSYNEKVNLTKCRLSDFKRKGKLGRGRFGKVYRVMEKGTKIYLAMKEVRKRLEIYSLESGLEKEHVVMAKLKSPWLMQMFQCYETRYKWHMLMQYLPGPTLLQIVKKGALIDQYLVENYAAQMLLAIYAVHSHGYMHRDIKLSNFRLDANGSVKLCGFASCIRYLPENVARKVYPRECRNNPLPEVKALEWHALLESQYQSSVPHGTCYYCAPEVICLATLKPAKSSYTYLCDYWSYGVCIYYLAYLKLPFYSDEKVQIPSLIIHWDRTLKFPKSRPQDNAVVDIIRLLLQGEDQRLGRNGIHEISAHPYFRNTIWRLLSNKDCSIGSETGRLSETMKTSDSLLRNSLSFSMADPPLN